MTTNIGTEPQDIPLNQFLGEMAFMDGPLRQLVKDDNKLEIDSSNNLIWTGNNVGIGTTNPGGLLTIRKQIEVSAAISNTNSHLSLVSDGAAGAEHQSVLHFGPRNGSTNTSPAAISAIASGNTASDLAFYVNSNNNYSQTPNTEVLRISSAGNVGIKKYPGSADSLDIFGGFRVQGNIRTKDYYKTGTTSEQQYTLRDTLANSSFEADPLSHPFLMNDLASFIARGGTVTFSGLTTAPGGLEQLFSTKGHVYFANSSYSGSTFTITLTNLPRGLNYGTFFGATFGSAAFSPLSCKIETSTDGGGNWTTRLDHTGSQFNYFTKAEIGGVSCNAIRYTLGKGNTTGVRIQNFWAFNYNSHGMEQYFMPRSGGELYGNMSFPSGNGIDFSANANATGMTSELLDDYEEGTWTPEVRDNFSAGNLGSQDLAEGYYTKIGNKVDVWGRLSNINTSGMNSSFDFCMAGLPFTSTSSHTIVGGDVTTNFITFSGELGVRLEGGRSSIRLHETASGSNNDFVTISQVNSSTADVFMHITYFVD